MTRATGTFTVSGGRVTGFKIKSYSVSTASLKRISRSKLDVIETGKPHSFTSIYASAISLKGGAA